MEPSPVAVPHVLVLPIPLQGHINSMLKLSELISLAGFHVTFLNTEHIHRLLLHFTNVTSRFARWPGFHFATIPDGLPFDHPRSGPGLVELFDSLKITSIPLLREMLVSNRWGSDVRPPVTCIIADGIMSFTIDVARDLNIPTIFFRTVSACSFWAYFCVPKLIEAGEIPFRDADMDCPITCVPGMENFLRRADLPGSCRTNNLGDRTLQFLVTETINTTRASALILNTFEDLEGPILCQIRSHCPRLYTIGPLHALLKTQISDSSPSVSSNSLWEENKSCIRWLDSKPLRSVVYVSFGSLATMTRDEVLEFWHGLVNSGKPFLWVIRPDLLARKEGEDQILTELVEGTRERAYIVEWAPQEEVLAHPAVGGFLTHSGWNSTLESIYAGVPMICWPYFADQQINSRFVSEVWKLGLDMKDTCDRLKVELMVKEVMERKRDEMIKSAENMAKLARMSVGEGGSSSCNLDKLIQDIRSMCVRASST
ncbi:PREDICTED: 7-deoxyloganetic acid glucosyltransferase-like [Nelumbo nucifera]|uniref:Glycosyltransferase n=1 Tax=Nelumbo nucifera TaxID=4432 RepID=A0A1U8ABG5_NELNU|nr:PREDICTED: 7-deoxyloganetic acid glucosyltransferase-like [Nelumbo nucifera]XP_010262687.1 PREDICTED: 7-deoxyloganetic acid glucosyltransferase-like [Nelumbo nucifera]XP_010262688.1 PREDICTED: 7-deoxyloganetic acid glucosyltransferase-like [Nelumbo nucifera]XP_019053966.1 PREDICTED: 7-deoxyloganetic acid glucosyltransferase-like [Nelumbo nucifera]